MDCRVADWKFTVFNLYVRASQIVNSATTYDPVAAPYGGAGRSGRFRPDPPDSRVTNRKEHVP